MTEVGHTEHGPPQASAPDAVVALRLADARCHPGEYAQRVADLAALKAAGLVQVDNGSQEHHRSQSPFDQRQCPGPDHWVPLDCAWARYPYPGPMSAPRGRGIRARLAALGNLCGRPMTELREALGEPRSLALDHQGGFARWRLSAVAPWRTLTVFFDSYGVCAGPAPQALAGMSPHQRQRTLRRVRRELSG